MKKLLLLLFLPALVAAKGLTREQAGELTTRLWNERKAQLRAETENLWDSMIIRDRRWVMPFGYKIYGDKPADGRSLYISMHGGGNTTPEMNSQQWYNQLRLYTPAEGVYVAPRAAVDDWNMWFRPHIDTLFTKLIHAAVAHADVNPDKVYIMGYSAGGDGVYRMAPRMADHWAAAAMMAGHPGESSLLNLRNTPLTLWMGGADAAYDRNTLAVGRWRQLDSLQAADPEGYVHDVHILPGMPHWMNRADSVAVPWMAEFRRTPHPDRVVWRQEETNPREYFYYLSVPREELRGGLTVRVDKKGNTFNITQNDYTGVTIWLNDAMVNFDEPVEIQVNGKRVFRKKLKRNEELIRRTAHDRSDPAYIFSAAIEVRANKGEIL